MHAAETKQADLVIIGAGAAGLMAGIWAGRTNSARSILVLDSAKRLGTKILISGGGRCNVTHDQVEATAFAGSSRHAISKVLRRFEVAQTIAFFRELGVPLKREKTGKLFPVSDSARTVLEALLSAARDVGVQFLHPWRVEAVRLHGENFHLIGAQGTCQARRLILATGGKSLPRTGSEGSGYEIARACGHTLTPRIFPGLVPLLLPREHFICALRGVATPATVAVHSGTGKKIIACTNAVLCTHFGLSGPAVLDLSRHYLAAKFEDPAAALVINWWPESSAPEFEQELLTRAAASVQKFLRTKLPERLAHALCQQALIEPATPCQQLTRAQRQGLVKIVTQMTLPVAGSRGFDFAEVTAGGVPLRELELDTMESRMCAGLYLCGEICDVDGRIGGFNFQWAWASGFVAGTSANG